MASVRLTESIRTDILGNAQRAFNAPIRLALETLADDFGDRCYNFAFRKELKIMKSLPKGFFTEKSQLYVSLENFQGNKYSMALSFTVNRLIPASYDKHNSRLIINNSALYDEYTLTHNQVKAAEAEQKEIANLIQQGFDNATTLNKLLKILPEIEMFVPDHIMQHHYKSEPTHQRPKVKKEEISTNQSQVVSLAKLKMMGAKTR